MSQTVEATAVTAFTAIPEVDLRRWHGGDAERELARFADAGIDTDALATRLQDEGAETFVKSWQEMLESVKSKGEKVAASS